MRGALPISVAAVPVAAMVVMALLVTCTEDDSGDDGSAGSSQAYTFWIPSATGMVTFFEKDVVPLAADRGFTIELDADSCEYPQVASQLRTTIGSGSMEADYVVVPQVIGDSLLDEGLLVGPGLLLFGSEDPAEAANLLAVLVAPVAGAAPKALAKGSLNWFPSRAVYHNGCFVGETENPLSHGSGLGKSGTSQTQSGETVEGTVQSEWQEAVRVVEEWIASEGMSKAMEMTIAYYGYKAAATVFCRACLALSAAKATWAVIRMSIASWEAGVAQDAALEAAVQTAWDTEEAMGDLIEDLGVVRDSLRSCGLSGQEGLDRIVEIRIRLQQFSAMAYEAVGEIKALGGPSASYHMNSTDITVKMVTMFAGNVRTEAVNKVTSEQVAALQETAGELIQEDATDPMAGFAAMLTGLDPDNPFTHSDGVKQTTSQGETDLTGRQCAHLDFSAAAAQRVPEVFPCGAGQIGLTVCAGQAFPEGESIVVAVTFADNVALSSADSLYQYGFVFDSDNDETNNFRASTDYPKDLYDNTDLWYDLSYHPTNGWALNVTDAATDGPGGAVASAARATINENSIVLVAPSSEFKVADPAYRVTAFRHSGDYGMNPPHDFNGDVSPEVGEVLAPPLTTVYNAREQ